MLQLFVDRGWSLDLGAARHRFPCKRCRSSIDVMILPARPMAQTLVPPTREISWAEEVAGFFHASRALSKARRKTDAPGLGKALAMLKEIMGPEHRPDPKSQRIEYLD